MLRRLLTALLALLAMLAVRVPVLAEGAQRALLLGFDVFVTQENTAPAAANNVARMEAALSGGEMSFDRITVSVNEVATVDAFEALALEALGDAKQEDTSYFYISTHGLWQPGEPNEEMRLLLSDGETEESLTAARLRTIFDQIPGTKVLILDACHSGAMIGKGVHAPFTNVFAGGDYKVLCSSGGAEESWLWTNHESGESFGAGYFSTALTNGITMSGAYGADVNRDGSITLTEIKRYLLEHHGASTTRCYPEEDDFVLFRYDPQIVMGQRRGVTVDALMFDTDVMDEVAPAADFSFTVHMPVRVAYQLVHQEKGRWDFSNVTMLWDNAERYGEFGDVSGYLSPGVKSRTITIDREEETSYGYALLQMLTVEDGEPSMVSSRVLCIPPLYGNPKLAFEMPAGFTPSLGEEYTFAILHEYPCEITVLVEDLDGNPVRRLTSRQATRPEHLSPMGSTMCWTGKLADGSLASPGTYRIRATAYVGGMAYEALSAPFMLRGE